VDGVWREGDAWHLATAAGRVRAEAVVVATGGLTVPKIGATPFGYRLAEKFGLAIVPPQPALVPLALPPDALARYGDLSGVSVDVEASCGGARFRESLLFTHRGLSGPAILQVSSYWDGREPIAIDLLPGIDAVAWLLSEKSSAARLDTLLATRLPQRFAQQWCEAHRAAVPVRQIPEIRLRELAAEVGAWKLLPSGTLGYNKAEVTRGGVDTRGLSSKTMAAVDVPGLHFIGEVVDVTGWLGGYNFQWAWASGHAAGMHA
jgi:predicted Rossmann fold flavoprotein